MNATGEDAVDPWHGDVAAVAASTARVAQTVMTLSDEQLHASSLLPGWSRGHVITHLARNADSLHNLVTWASTGVETPAYVSDEVRDADIDAGAHRSGEALVDDLVNSSQRLQDALAGLDAETRQAKVRMRDGSPVRGRALPTVRLRELEIHHVDLDAGYRPADWPTDFVTVTLDKLAPMFAGRGNVEASALAAHDGRRWTVGPDGRPTLHGSATDLLVWLVGRALPVEITTESGAAAPASPQW